MKHAIQDSEIPCCSTVLGWPRLMDFFLLKKTCTQFKYTSKVQQFAPEDWQGKGRSDPVSSEVDVCAWLPSYFLFQSMIMHGSCIVSRTWSTFWKKHITGKKRQKKNTHTWYTQKQPKKVADTIRQKNHTQSSWTKRCFFFRNSSSVFVRITFV